MVLCKIEVMCMYVQKDSVCVHVNTVRMSESIYEGVLKISV